jgi:uncharacterized protein YjiS (DUF1127 family)
MHILHVWRQIVGLPEIGFAAYFASQQRLRPLQNGRANMTPFKTISEKLNAWRRYRDAVRELSQLSDRELADIGIRRGEIEEIVRRSATRAA